MCNAHIMDFQPLLTIVVYESTKQAVLISGGGLTALALPISTLCRVGRLVQRQRAEATGGGDDHARG